LSRTVQPKHGMVHCAAQRRGMRQPCRNMRRPCRNMRRPRCNMPRRGRGRCNGDWLRLAWRRVWFRLVGRRARCSRSSGR
jgi:hypothetical protein